MRRLNKDLIIRCEEAINSGEYDNEVFSEDEFVSLIDYYYSNALDQFTLLRVLNWAHLCYSDSKFFLTRYIETLILRKEYEVAIDTLLASDLFQEEDSGISYLMGKALIKQGFILKAITIYDISLKGSGDNYFYVLESIVTDCIECECFDEAISYLNRVPMDTMPLSMLSYLSFCYEQVANYYKCIEAANASLNRDPFNAEVWFYLGMTYHKIEDYDRAIEAYDYALALVKGNISYKFHKALAYWAKGDYHAAKSLFMEYLDTNVDNLYGLLGLADCHLNLYELDFAAQLFSNILRLYPACNEAEIGLACAKLLELYIMGDKDGFYNEITTLKLISKHFKDILYELAPKIGDDAEFNALLEEIIGPYNNI